MAFGYLPPVLCVTSEKNTEVKVSMYGVFKEK